MKLYNLTLQRPTGITHAVHGNFSGVKLQEIIVSRGRMLELLKPDPNTGKVHTLLTQEIFGVVRSLMSFRLTGGSKGQLISKYPYKKSVSSKIPTKLCLDFCPEIFCSFLEAFWVSWGLSK